MCFLNNWAYYEVFVPPDFSLNPIKAILFDLDGTLVHSILDFRQIRKDISCPESQDVLSFLETLSDDARANAESIIMQHELDDAHATQIIDGASSLLERLDSYGIKTAIVTRNSQLATQIKIQKAGLNVEQILTREDAPAKPKPDALLYFSKLWNVEPQSCVYVGDYLYDLQAADNANMHACLYVHRSESALPYYADLAGFICRDFDKFEEYLSDYLQAVHLRI